MMKHFINLADFSAEQLRNLLTRALSDKKLFRTESLPASLKRKTLAMIFDKPSLRTRVSFDTAMTHLGGRAIKRYRRGKYVVATEKSLFFGLRPHIQLAQHAASDTITVKAPQWSRAQ